MANNIIHVQVEDEHYYFGSIAAIYMEFTPKQLGVSKHRLWSFKITHEKPYKNKICTVRKGVLCRKKGNRSIIKK